MGGRRRVEKDSVKYVTIKIIGKSTARNMICLSVTFCAEFTKLFRFKEDE